MHSVIQPFINNRDNFRLKYLPAIFLNLFFVILSKIDVARITSKILSRYKNFSRKLLIDIAALLTKLAWSSWLDIAQVISDSLLQVYELSRDRGP